MGDCKNYYVKSSTGVDNREKNFELQSVHNLSIIIMIILEFNLGYNKHNLGSRKDLI